MNAFPEPHGRAYLAGPDVFAPDPGHESKILRKICAKFGFIGVFPTDGAAPEPGMSKCAQAHLIYRENAILIESCDLMLANMMPFRGPSMDVGTAFEIGYARALGQPVFGYGVSEEDYADSVGLKRATTIAREDDGRLTDADGFTIEDFGLPDNLMPVCALAGEPGNDIRDALAEARAWALSR